VSPNPLFRTSKGTLKREDTFFARQLVKEGMSAIPEDKGINTSRN